MNSIIYDMKLSILLALLLLNNAQPIRDMWVSPHVRVTQHITVCERQAGER